MRHFTVFSAVTALAMLFLSPTAFACSCTKPQAPDIPADVFIRKLPDGDLNAKQSAVKRYIFEVASYQQCLVDCIKGVNYELTDISVEAERVVADWKRVVHILSSVDSSANANPPTKTTTKP